MSIRDRAVSTTILVTLGVTSLVTSRTIRYRRWNARSVHRGRPDVVVVPGIRLTPQGQAHRLLRQRVAMGRLVLDDYPSAWLLVSGGHPRAGVTEADRMSQLAAAWGVPRARIALEPCARTTEENARYTAGLMVDRGWRRGLLVSHRLHLGYAVPVFQEAFVDHGLELFWQPVDHDRLRQRGLEKVRAS